VKKRREVDGWMERNGMGNMRAHPHPHAAVFEPMHARACDGLKKRTSAAIFLLRVGCLGAEPVQVRPSGATRHGLVVRKPGGEPVVRSVPVVDPEHHEQALAERD
jgi:hypothetical protein